MNKITYKTADGVDLHLHVFEPAGHRKTDRRPAIIFFFGGGWVGGTPEQFYQQARYCSALGMVALSADYRVGITPFECVKDGKSAVRWVRHHADQLGVDPRRIVASGGSAGGHVAACTGVIPGHEEYGEDLRISSVPGAMILFNPVIDTTEAGFGMDQVGVARKTDISPCHHVHKGIPPTLVFHGTADTTVPFENAERFTRLMTAAGNVCRLVPFEGRGHGFFNGREFLPQSDDKDFDATMRETAEFLVSQDYLPEPQAKRSAW